ncbi:unnamed protein product [Mytilus edulis]|uniref:Uncharacterized protein n=1 Tax=Mytilus edulis TaxID=6550 RepID=A0A8S3UV91_MYTED|nr:unnamed protein product [Mytilus edulis]
MNKLLELDISKNKLTTISIDAFDGLHNLKRLTLENNRLKDSYSYPLGVFKYLVSLVYLNIKFNNNDELLYSILPDDVISDLVKLESLELDIVDRRFSVYVFGDGFSRLSILKRIKTGACHIDIVNNQTFSNLPHLEFIDLSNCVIYHYVVGTLSERKQLVYLDMSNVLMKIDSFKDLFEEDIQSSKVKIVKANSMLEYSADLPLCFFRILNDTGIEELYITNNSFVVAENVHIKMCNAVPTTLKLLDFSNNKLTKFCFEIPYLVTLNLKNNFLARYLAHNSYMDNYTGTSELEKIDLSFNEIISLSFTIFHFQPKLKFINLSHNFLSNITFDLSHNINLQLLDLSSNRIKLFKKEQWI